MSVWSQLVVGTPKKLNVGGTSSPAFVLQLICKSTCVSLSEFLVMFLGSQTRRLQRSRGVKARLASICQHPPLRQHQQQQQQQHQQKQHSCHQQQQQQRRVSD